ncbi:MAG: SGNH/GDSL hydrolase family protein [Verrucomicrobiota bacterium]
MNKLLILLACCSLGMHTPSMAMADNALGLVTSGGPGGWGFFPDQKRDPALRRVLLIGDSIVNGYRGVVARELEGKASIDVWLTPAMESDPALPEDLRKVLGQGPYAVVYFNIGLHGWEPGRVAEGQYEPLMRNYVSTLRRHAAGAKLIWASSTPVTVQNKPMELDPAGNPVIAKRNASAGEIMKEYGIPINDLYGLVIGRLELGRGDGAHWQAPAYELMGKQAAQLIRTTAFLVSPTGEDSKSGTKTKRSENIEVPNK